MLMNTHKLKGGEFHGIETRLRVPKNKNVSKVGIFILDRYIFIVVGGKMILSFLVFLSQVVGKFMQTFAFMILSIALSTTSHAIAASTQASGQHLHVGHKIANYFRSFGLPDVVVLAIISALPVVELRGAIPVGLWMGLPLTTVLPACVIGNMIPILPILLVLRNNRVK
jgi:hypothetical protein